MAEKALTTVIQETYIQDISTRSVDDLVTPRQGTRPSAHIRTQPLDEGMNVNVAMSDRAGPDPATTMKSVDGRCFTWRLMID
jgi:hypothetical protein